MAGRRDSRGGRRRDAEATRRKLLRAGRRAFARRGLSGALLKEDVLDAAGVSVGSFYHQFDDKTDLLMAVLEDGARRLEPRRRALLGTLAGERTRSARVGRFYAGLLAWARRNPDLWRIAARERFGDEPRVRRFLARERERWVEDLARGLAPRGREATVESRRLAAWMVRLAHAAADDAVAPGPRGARTTGLEGALVGWTLRGARGLGPREAVTPTTSTRAIRG